MYYESTIAQLKWEVTFYLSIRATSLEALTVLLPTMYITLVYMFSLSVHGIISNSLSPMQCSQTDRNLSGLTAVPGGPVQAV